jgi:protein SDA1
VRPAFAIDDLFFSTLTLQFLFVFNGIKGKPTEATRELKPLRYGEVDVKSFVPGSEVIDVDGEKQENGNGKEDDEWQECSGDDDDDDNDDEWVDLKHTSDEEEESTGDDENKDTDGAKQLNETDKNAKAILASTQCIFTQDDFKRIQQEQLRRKVEDKTKKSADKRKTVDIDDSDDEDAKRDGLLPLSSITHVNKKRKHDKESRLATVMEGREDRGKFGQRFKEAKLGKSNKEKKKTKAYMMVKHKINNKHKRSFRDKQLALRKSLMKQKKMK